MATKFKQNKEDDKTEEQDKSDGGGREGKKKRKREQEEIFTSGCPSKTRTIERARAKAMRKSGANRKSTSARTGGRTRASLVR